MTCVRPRILVVDDEELIRRLLDRMLTLAGYEVTTAESGHEALKRLAATRVHLVLLDIMMPGVDGFQTLQLIREKYDVPVIMLTGKGEVTTLRDALNIGADDYVRKPFRKLELLARIEAKLRRSGPVSEPAELAAAKEEASLRRGK